MNAPSVRTANERDDGAAGYGEVFADVYDEWYGGLGDVEAVVSKVATLAGAGAQTTGVADANGRRVLELGVGTGRLAIPLAERGARAGERGGFVVEGVDNSAAMLKRLRDNDVQQLVQATECDMSKTLPLGPFEVIFAAYNTFFNLLTEQAQRACLALAARRLSPTGSLAIEAFVPRADLLTTGEGHTSGEVVEVGGPTVGEGHAGKAQRATRLRVNRAIRFGPDQRIDGEIVSFDNCAPNRAALSSWAPGGWALEAAPQAAPEVRPWSIRYVTPDQLDVMARAVGLELAERRASWSDEPFDANSAAHVSRYVKSLRGVSRMVVARG